VRAYLDLMHMRMPDRLRYTIQVEDEARALHCPPMTLLTLVENAVRHGIDPSEEGGLIDIRVARRGPRCHVLVRDTGAGLSETGKSLGTGLSTLRERLRLAFAGDARVTVTEEKPQGVRAELEFPAVEAAA
jgi:LytS/YehU family sensor histidine kinase